MPSPFPGMDPFLEHRFFFPDLHGSLNYCIRGLLQQTLPPPYYAVLNERLWVETSYRPVEPDVDVLHGTSPGPFREESGGAVAVAAQPIVIPILHDERRETFVDIMTRTDLDERIVTTIEVLSLTNKTPGEQGRELYQRKQHEVIDGDINLVEIDLLRGGEHTTAVPRINIVQRIPQFDYHVCIAKASDRDNRYVYTFRMQDRLPTIEIPLLTRDAPVKLDLQAALDRAYDDGPYSRRVRYELERVVPPLTAEQAAWVAEVLGRRLTS